MVSRAVSRTVLTFALLGSFGGTAFAAATPEAKCAAGKIDLSGKYAACVSKAERSLVLTGDSGKYATLLAQCEEKLTARWTKLEASSACWSQGDKLKVKDFLEATVWGLTKGITLGGEPGGNPSSYVTSVECFELQQCCIVKVTYYSSTLETNVTNSYSNCNTTHTWEQL